jgi:TetR/AcrR family transcriptional regulator, fatty acid metabolism regulator protein
MSVHTQDVPRKRTVLAPDERRQQLLEAATWVFARKGYRRAGISDVIARAGVARGTFYLYFDSREHVFLAIVEDFHKKISQAIAAAIEPSAQPIGDPEAMLRTSFRRWLGFFAANRDATTVILKEASSIDPRFEKGFVDLRRSAVDFFAARYRRFQELGLVRPSIRPVLMAHLLIGMFDELLNAFVLTDPNADLDALAAQLADFEWNGIRPH